MEGTLMSEIENGADAPKNLLPGTAPLAALTEQLHERRTTAPGSHVGVEDRRCRFRRCCELGLGVIGLRLVRGYGEVAAEELWRPVAIRGLVGRQGLGLAERGDLRTICRQRG